MCLSHTKRLINIMGEKHALKQMRGLASWYIQGMPYSARIKNATSKLETYNDLDVLLSEYLEKLSGETN